MSQIYKEMNKTGKMFFYMGSLFALVGILLVVSGYNDMGAMGATSVAVGLYHLGVSQYDSRCYIKNDSKGIPLATTKEAQITPLLSKQ